MSNVLIRKNDYATQPTCDHPRTKFADIFLSRCNRHKWSYCDVK